jgi:hypothetical protein
MKKSYYLFLLFYSLLANAQVGIGTTNPQATLDIRETNPAAPSAKAGIAISQVSVLPTTGNRAGQLIYLTTNNSYYFYNGSIWQPLVSGGSAVFGDVKNGYQTTDHNGWVLLNGRLLTTLTPTQQVTAAALGFVANLPNVADKSIVGASPTKALNTTGGADNVILSRDQLPDFSLNTLPGEGMHTHLYYWPTYTTTYVAAGSNAVSYIYNYGTFWSNYNGYYDGAHTHTTESVNGGVPQSAINIQNPYITMNGFIYLGL